jgi:hypothetical protein
VQLPHSKQYYFFSSKTTLQSVDSSSVGQSNSLNLSSADMSRSNGLSSAADMSRRKQKNPKPCFSSKEDQEKEKENEERQIERDQEMIEDDQQNTLNAR